ncbi:unnamed protein product [Penicillium camemberti]|uniref:Str. FM013 n=1 Tax=Penicillium camemberti (strain FM 013) TaxID=1429867 RepID=A0A0G4P310_PENC3|nr:unnamed protein product [Penicillium camemberti]
MVELLTQLRHARTSRAHTRAEILRQARWIIRQMQLIRTEYAADGREPLLHLLWGLEQRMHSVFHRFLALLAEEDAARTFEAEFWGTLA